MSDVRITIDTNDKELLAALKRVKDGFEGVRETGQKSAQGVVRGQQDVAKSVKDMSSTAQAEFRASQGAADTFAGVFTSQVLVAGIQAVAGAFRSLAGTIRESIGEAVAKQEIQQRLANTLEITGRNTDGAADRLRAFGNEIQRTTRFTGDQTAEALTLLATMTELDEEGLQAATRAAIDLAAATGVSLTTAIQNVGRAANGEVTQFRRLGLVIEQGEDAAETFDNTLELISQRMGGAAAADANTFAGAMAQLQNEIDDAKAALGAYFIENELVQKGIQSATELFRTLQDVLQGNNATFNQYKEILIPVAAALGGIAAGVVAVTTAMVAKAVAVKALTIATTAFGVALNLIPLVAIATGIGALIGVIVALARNWDRVQLTVTESMANILRSVLNAAGPIARIFGIDPNDGALARGLEALEERAGRLRERLEEQAEVVEDAGAEVERVQEQANQREQARQQAQFAKLQEAAAQHNQKMLEIEQQAAEKQAIQALEFEAKRTEVQDIGREEQIEKAFEFELRKIELQQDAELRRAALIEDAAERERAIQEIRNNALLAQQAAKNKAEIDQEKRRVAELKELDKQRENDQKDFMRRAVSLSTSQNRELAAIGKAAAVAQVLRDTPPAISSAFRFGTSVGGPKVGGVFAGIAAAAQAQQLARAKGLNFQDGGIVPGTSFTGDRVQANVNSGEMVLNRQQQARLFDLANSGGGAGQEIVVHTTVELDGEKLGLAVSRQVADGLKLGEAV